MARKIDVKESMQRQQQTDWLIRQPGLKQERQTCADTAVSVDDLPSGAELRTGGSQQKNNGAENCSAPVPLARNNQ